MLWQIVIADIKRSKLFELYITGAVGDRAGGQFVDRF